MKTTVEIADSLYHELKLRATRERTTIRGLIDAALRSFLSPGSCKPAKFKLKDGAVGGRGVAPGVREGAWTQIRNLIYEGRGA